MTTVLAVLNPTGLSANSKPAVELFFRIDIVNGTIVTVGGTSGETTNLDQIVIEETSASYGQKFIINIELTPTSGELDEVVITSHDTDVATVENGNELTYVSDGVCEYSVEVTNTIGTSLTRNFTLAFDEMAGTVITSITGGAVGSVRKDATDAVDPIISAMWFDGSTDTVEFAAMPGATNATIKAQFRLNGADIEGVLFTDSVVNPSRYVAVYQENNTAAPNYRDAGTPVFKIDGVTIASRAQAYTILNDNKVHSLEVTGADISSWSNFVLMWYQTSTDFRSSGIMFNVSIDEIGDGIVDHFWRGDGNTDAGWVDQIGSNDGTVVGSPQLYNEVFNLLPMYTTQNHSTQTYVRNTNCWAYQYLDQLTAISPWNSTGNARRAGTLITPRHIIFAAHYQLSNNTTIRFVDPDNNVITRTMTHRKRHPNYSPYFPDLAVGVLDSDVPADIKFCKVLPDDWQDYIPTNIFRMPCLCLDQEEKAIITDGSQIKATTTIFTQPVSTSDRNKFYESKISGDSGNPAFLIIGGELVLLTVWTYGGAGSGTSVTYFKDDINQLILDVDALASVSTGYTLTEKDLSTYNDYS